ncbi:TaqI-like C-terminal specificity domain-containing protein [Flavobacterium sp. FlaQc-28]|uniref:TaqI-like C-terminal specificity domain-containing protein n=1 Tax=Flavobacterium sp. FlaQc-28 TaxID=3374178 RepID=UPI00375677B2
MLRGRDIKRYGYEFGDLWLINTHNGIKESGLKSIKIEDYPAIKQHLDKYYMDLEKRSDKGETPYNLRNCAYMEDFSKQKIVWAETMRIHKDTSIKFPRFGIDNGGELLTDKTCFFATGQNIKYIMAILNSTLGRYLCSKYVSILDDGGYLMQKIYLEKIPIPKEIPKILELIDELLTKSNCKQIDEIEDEIDSIIFAAIQLSIEEINFIRLTLQ